MMTDEERDRIRESVDIGGLVGEDIALRQRGGRLWGRCPFHDERTPSFAVDPVRGTYHCFACQAHGDVFDYVMRARGLTFPEAAEALAARAGVTLSNKGRRGIPRERAAKALRAAAAWACEVLADTARADASEARAWLESHGIGGDAARRWGIGLAPGRGEMARALRAAGFASAELRAAGILGDGGDTIHHAACVPVRDAAGGVVGLAAQAIGPNMRATATPSGPLRARAVDGAEVEGAVPFARGALFGMDVARDAIRRSGRALVTLGPVGVVALHESGVCNVVSTLGGGLGPRQARELAAAGVGEVTLLYPDDRPAGVAAAAASLPQALAMPARVTWATVDADDMARPRVVGADEPMGACDRAPGLVEGMVDRIARKRGTDDPEGLLEGAREACEALAIAAGGDWVRARLLSVVVAERFGVCDPESLMGPLTGSGEIGDESWREARDAWAGAATARPPDIVRRTVAVASGDAAPLRPTRGDAWRDGGERPSDLMGAYRGGVAARGRSGR